MMPDHFVPKANTMRLLACVFLFISLTFCISTCLLAAHNPLDANATGLYVLTVPAGQAHNTILNVDPASGKTLRTLDVGLSADMAVSPDGSRLYVTSHVIAPAGDTSAGVLAIYDRSGQLTLTQPNPDGMQFTGAAHPKTLFMSPAGDWLYELKVHTSGQFSDFYIAAFDTAKERFLAGHASLLGCKAPVIIPSLEPLRVQALCRDSTYIRDTVFNETGAPLITPTPLPPFVPEAHFTVVFHDPDQQQLTAVSEAGHVLSYDGGTRLLSEGTNNIVLPSDVQLRLQHGLFSKSQQRVFFGSARVAHGYDEQFDQLISAFVTTGSLDRSIPVQQPFFSVELSKDEKTLYLISPTSSTITLVTTANMKIGPTFHLRYAPIYALSY
jgi:hypothetical protein